MKPAWLEIAEKEIGVKENSEPGKDNPRIVEYHSTTTLKATNDETPWCSAFVNWCMAQAGIKGTRSAAARSWIDWGEVLATPREGCVVVMKRGAPPSGHVGFFIRYNDKYICVLGGNQSDQVKYSQFLRSDVIAFRWPKGVK